MVQHSTIDHTGLTGVSTVSYASNANSVADANTGGAATTQSRGDHVHLGVRSISHTSNTFSGPITITAEGDLGITSPSTGTLAFKAISGAGGGGGGYSTLTVADAQVGADVGIGSSAYTDVLSLALGAGTWDVWGYADVANGAGGSGTVYVQIATSGDVQLAQEGLTIAVSQTVVVPVLAPSVAGSQTIKLRVYSTQSGNAQGTTSVGSPGGGTKLHALRIA